MKFFFDNVFKRALILLIQVTSFIIFVAVMTNVLSYFSRWTDDKPTNKILSVCYVAVEGKEKFISYSDYQNQALFLGQSQKKKLKYSSWLFENQGEIKTVTYRNDDLSATFKYRVSTKTVHPLSCQYLSPSHGLTALLYTVLMTLFGRVIFTFLRNKKI